MSERTAPLKTMTTADEDEDEPDNSEPSEERQAELRAAYEANVATGTPPYKESASKRD